MLGHIKPPLCRLSPAAAARYRLLYCSLCASLRTQFGVPYAALLSHETSLGLLACADDFDGFKRTCACPARGFLGRRSTLAHPRVDLAARMNLLLVWLKLTDSAADGRGQAARCAAWIVERRVRSFWGELSIGLRDFLGAYVGLIRASTPDFAEIRQSSGLLAAQVFQELAPDAAAPLRETASLLGEIVPVADALLDVDEDLRRGQYNPVVEAARRPGVSLGTAREALHGEYLDLAERARGALARIAGHADFVEAADLSLHGLSGRLAFAAGASGGAESDRRRKRGAPSRDDRRCDGCCDSLECCGSCDAGCCDFCGGCDGCCGCDGCG